MLGKPLVQNLFFGGQVCDHQVAAEHQALMLISFFVFGWFNLVSLHALI